MLTGEVVSTLPDLRASVLVVAHPDDEVLWFSSLLKEIERIVVCFEDCDDLPGLGQARRDAMARHPLSNVTWLGLPEPCSVEAVDWNTPVETDEGLALNAPATIPVTQHRYRSSFSLLHARLRDTLGAASNVFTHNPWGEYGHPDHVQVCRAVTRCKQEHGFRLWFSNYVSPRSMPLASRHLGRLMNHFKLPIDARLADELREIYGSHGAWTWHQDYLMPSEEAFLEDSDLLPRQGASAPLNCVRT